VIGKNRASIVFVLFTLALSSIFYFLIIRSGHIGGGGGAYAAGLMWCPGLGALVTCKYLGRDIRSLGWHWGEARYQLACYLIPLTYSVVIYLVVWLTGVGGFYRQDFVDSAVRDFGLGSIPPWAALALSFFFTATVGVLNDCATALGEEIGWRGFLVPELAATNSFTATALISGVIWASWHYPILLFPDYNPGTPAWHYLTAITLIVPAISFVWTWMRLKSGSLWTGVVLHASHNTFIQQFFQPLTVDRKWTRYLGEFGALLFMLAVSLAIYFWTRRGEVSTFGREGKLATTSA
jgi:uncharacterized protein